MRNTDITITAHGGIIRVGDDSLVRKTCYKGLCLGARLWAARVSGKRYRRGSGLKKTLLIDKLETVQRAVPPSNGF